MFLKTTSFRGGFFVLAIVANYRVVRKARPQ